MEPSRTQSHVGTDGMKYRVAMATAFTLPLPILYFVSRANYLFFHSVVELVCIAVAWGVFLLAWNARRMLRDHALVFLGLSFAFVGGLDLLHVISYKGMGVFLVADDANPATQLWISARAMAAFSFMAFPFILGRQLRIPWVVAVYAVAWLLLTAAILLWEVFPACFAEGVGLTPFKRSAECVICLLLAGALLLMYRRRAKLDPSVFRLITAALLMTIFSEFTFTLYADVYGVFNFAGHYLRLIAMYLFYRALIGYSLTAPCAVLFRELEMEKEELRRAEQALKASEARFRNMFERHSAVKLLIDPESGAIVDANPAAAAYYGWSKDELCGKRIQEINVLSPEMVAQEMMRAANSRRNYFEFRHRRADGSLRDVAVFSGDVSGGGKPLLLSVIHDIIERKQAETALRESEERFRSLVEQAPAGIFIQTHKRFAYVNAEMMRLLGATGPGQLIGEMVESRVHPDFRALARERIRQLSEQRLLQPPMDQVFVRLDGSLCNVSVSGVPFRFGGEPGALVFVQDITERRLVEDAQRFMVQCGLPARGEDFFISLARYLATALSVDYVSIGRLLGGSAVESLATWDRGTLAPNGCRELDGSPCGLAMGAGVYHCPAGARQVFPRHGPIEELGAESLYAIRLSDSRGEPIGFICLAGRNPMPNPVPAQLVLDVAAPRAAAELERRRQESVAEENHKRLISVINAMPDPVYVSDPVTYELLFVNDALRSLFGEFSGRTCHEYLQGRDSPCSFCTNDKLFGANFGKPVEWEFQNLKNGKWYRMVDRGITWPDGRHVRFEMATDMTAAKQAESALRDSLAEKTALIKEVHHRVKNNLQVVASLLSLQERRQQVPEALEVLHDTQARVTAMALLHEVLYRSENLATVDVAAYVERLCASLLRAVGPVASRVQVVRDIAPVRLPLDQAVPCGLIINELVSNALKHGYSGGRSGRVVIDLRPQERGTLLLRVIDDGVGLPAGFDAKNTSTLGLNLVFDLVRQLGGECRLGTARRERGADAIQWSVPSEGTEIRVLFPVADMSVEGGVA